MSSIDTVAAAILRLEDAVKGNRDLIMQNRESIDKNRESIHELGKMISAINTHLQIPYKSTGFNPDIEQS